MMMDPNEAELRLLRALMDSARCGGVVLCKLEPEDAMRLAGTILWGVERSSRSPADRCRRLEGLARRASEAGQ